jgi:glycosyltransferase involved in cell wall biosynthesis
MRIATLSNASVVHTQRWVDRFRARGHDVLLLSLERPPHGLETHLLPRAPLPGALRYPLALPALLGELRAFQPDLVDAHFVPNYGVLAALAGRHPLSVTAWGSDLLVTGRQGVLQRARAGFVLRRADLVLADAENLAAAARELGARPERVRALPWGIDRSRFVPGPEREAGLLLSTRMHEDIYDIPLLLAAAAKVMARHAHARLVVTGDGSLRPALQREAERRLPPGRCTFLGRLSAEDLAAWLGRADVYLSASRSDSTSLSLLEAMACEALPVVSDIEGNREWVAEGDGARLFAVGDADACARAIDAALSDAAWAASARTRNARVVAERGDARVNMARIETWFERLVARRPLEDPA